MSSNPSDSDVLIKVDNVSKKFCRDFKKSLWYGVKDTAADILHPRRALNSPPSPLSSQTSSSDSYPTSELRSPTSAALPSLRPSEFWANQNISFEVRRGECLGLIGRNGAGKTTLLKMLNGLIKPDTGIIEMRGRIGALIALGAGFNPILTGRENIYINGSILGLSKKEIDAKLDEIVDFAEIEDAIDAPVRTYSSGMQVRLGFSIASTLEPDILILDEVLAVGDANFILKCYRRIDRIRTNASVIFVSHNMPNVVRICNKSIVLDRGEIQFSGTSKEAADYYNSVATGGGGDELVTVYPPIRRIAVGGLPASIQFNHELSLSVSVDCDEPIEDVLLSIDVKNLGGGYVASTKCSASRHNIKIEKGATSWRIDLSSIPLVASEYRITVGILSVDGSILAIARNIHRIMIKGGYPSLASDCQLDIKSWNAIPNTQTALI